jgi:hypothetical protein
LNFAEPYNDEVGTPHDLHTQFEEMLATVWSAEANWRFDDIFDMAVKVDARRTVRTTVGNE